MNQPQPIETIPGRNGPGRRERRKAETRARLLAAARTLFVERGYHGTRPQDIASAADLATGTFYIHFADKREAFLAFSEQASRELMERVHAAAGESSDFEDRIYRSLEALLGYSDENPGVLKTAFADATVIAADVPRSAGLPEQLAESIAQGLRQGMKAGRLVDEMDPDLIAHGIVGLVSQVLRYGTERGTPRETLLGNVTHFVSRALVSQG
ncbi:MAG: TetR/AcrR family transcriptional regulator [bacterium]|nr:TetR/AcrR family transcriptional regulator [bacterium]